MSTVEAGIVTTKHNLSISGPGSVKAATEAQVCIFCHTPHSASADAPLWNRRLSGELYIPYSSTTAIANPGQPTGSSILCLSCHDGTIALGELLSRVSDITMAGGITTMPAGEGNLTTDLSDDHPISFVYSAAISGSGEYVDPSTLTGPVRLDGSGQLQCTGCHDPHNNDNGKFLVKSGIASGLCTTCHIKTGWPSSPHNLSGNSWNSTPPDPWPTANWTTVSDNGCENCHQPHSAGSSERLLHYQNEEDNCAACHNGNVATKDIMSVFNSGLSAHPLTDTNTAHDPTEANEVSNRHVECVDCHNPHSARADADPILGVLNDVKGIDLSGTEVDPITLPRQLCFRCHGDSPGKPPATTPRQITQTNTRLEFQPTNPSFHPVGSPGVNPNVPSLIAPLTTASTIDCSDCHNSNAAVSAGGSGPEGPHGSDYESILVRQFVSLNTAPASTSNSALCYGCHDENSIQGNESFARHSHHSDNTGCNTCHDPHGISSTQGNSTNNTHLINFNTNAVTPNTQGNLYFIDNGLFSGTCALRCHNHNHRDATY
jgi:predicted CXXCH cytochrome family protein